MKWLRSRLSETAPVCAGVLITAILVGCGTGTGGGAKAAGGNVLRLGIFSDLIMHLPLFVAEKNKFFEAEGLVVVRETKYGKFRNAASLISDEADIILESTEAYFEIADLYGAKHYKIIGGLTATAGSAVISRSPVPVSGFSWSQIRHKRFLGRDKNSAPMYFLRSVLTTNGVDPANVKFNTSAPVPARTRIWSENQSHDYAIFYEPDASKIIRNGKGYLATMLGPAIGKIDTTVFIVKSAFLNSAKNRDLVQRFMNGMQVALTETTKASLDSLVPIAKRYAQDSVRGRARPFAEPDLISAIKRYRLIGLWKNDLFVAPRTITDMQRMIIENGGTKTRTHRCYEDVVDMRFAVAALAKYPSGGPIRQIPGPADASVNCG